MDYCCFGVRAASCPAAGFLSQNVPKRCVIRLSAGGQLWLAVPSSLAASRLRLCNPAALLGPARSPLPRTPAAKFRAAALTAPKKTPRQQLSADRVDRVRHGGGLASAGRGKPAQERAVPLFPSEEISVPARPCCGAAALPAGSGAEGAAYAQADASSTRPDQICYTMPCCPTQSGNREGVSEHGIHTQSLGVYCSECRRLLHPQVA